MRKDYRSGPFWERQELVYQPDNTCDADGCALAPVFNWNYWDYEDTFKQRFCAEHAAIAVREYVAEARTRADALDLDYDWKSPDEKRAAFEQSVQEFEAELSKGLVDGPE